MRQLITLAILAAIAAAGWFYWPTIKAKFLASQESAPLQPGEAPPQTTTPNPSGIPAPVSGIPAKGPDTTVPPLPEAKTGATVPPEGKTEAKSNPPVNGKPFHADFTAELVTQGLTTAIEGTTNLPAGTLLEMQVATENRLPDGRPETLPAEVITVRAASPRNVFRWSPTNTTSSKSFKLHVSLHPESQNGNVQQIIGPHGELLTGNLVVPRPAGGNYLRAISAPFALSSGGLSPMKSRRLKLVLKTSEVEREAAKDKGSAPGSAP